MLAPTDPLHVRAQHRWGRKCPCCTRPMERPRKKDKGRATKLTMTRGHDFPQAYGGHQWLYICSQCNQDQASRTFRRWLDVLIHRADYRAEHVMELVTWLMNRP